MYCTYICRSFYVFSSWFNYNNLLISHSNGTWYLLSSTGRLRARFLRLFFLARRLGNWQMTKGSRLAPGPGERLSTAAAALRLCFLTAYDYEILAATYVILHACLVYIFYVICMKMLLEGPPVRRRMTTHVVWGFQKFSILNSRPCYTHYNCTLNLKELI